MFGSLRPNLCQLTHEQGEAYRRMYCGTCKALGDHYGQLTRPLLSFDIVLFASVVEALQVRAAESGSCRCPALPIVHRSILQPSSPSMRLAAAVQVMLADQWLADQVQDGRRVVGLVRPLLFERARKACRDLEAFGIDTTALVDLSERQLRVEKRTRVIADAAEPTARVLESLFGQIGRLSAEDLDEPSTRSLSEPLARLGRHLGTAIYALDALEDLEGDLIHRRFNPCLDASGRLSSKSMNRVCQALSDALSGLEAAVAEIPWRRHRDIVHNVLCRRFQSTCRRALADAKSKFDVWVEAPPKRRAFPIRLGRSFLSMLAALWAMAGRAARVFSRRPERATKCDVRSVDEDACIPSPMLALAVDSGGEGGALHPPVDGNTAEGSGVDSTGTPPDPNPEPEEPGSRRRRRRRRKRKNKRKGGDGDGGCVSWFDDILCCSDCSCWCCEESCCEGCACEAGCCECGTCCECGCCHCS